MIVEIARHISNLIGIVDQKEHLDRVHGPNKGRTNEQKSLAWILDDLADEYPDEYNEAERMAADRRAWRASRDSGRNI